MLAPSAIEKQIELDFEHADDLPDIPGNATAIAILVRNLVDNAIRYCKEAGKVQVRVYKKNKTMVLSVQDNGPGIPLEFKSRVFERFFRVLGNKSTGSGLGLAIVKQICDLHGAKIDLNAPQEGTGLIVSVAFPLKRKLK